MTPFAHDIDNGIDVATNRPDMQTFARLTEAVSKNSLTADNDDYVTSKSSILVSRRRRHNRLHGRA